MVLTYKQKFNKKYGQPLNQSNSLTDISRLTGYKRAGLQTIYNKGIGAFKTKFLAASLFLVSIITSLALYS